MRRRPGIAAIGVAVLAGLSGCGSEPCGEWREQYEVSFDPRPSPAPCGDLPDVVGTPERLGEVGPDCSGSSRLDTCEIVIDEECCPAGSDTCTRFRGNLAQADGPSYLEGVVTLEGRDAETGEGLCLQTYDVTGRAL